MSLRLRAVLLAGLAQIYQLQVGALEKVARSVRDCLTTSARGRKEIVVPFLGTGWENDAGGEHGNVGIDLVDSSTDAVWAITLPMADLERYAGSFQPRLPTALEPGRHRSWDSLLDDAALFTRISHSNIHLAALPAFESSGSTDSGSQESVPLFIDAAGRNARESRASEPRERGMARQSMVGNWTDYERSPLAISDAEDVLENIGADTMMGGDPNLLFPALDRFDDEKPPALLDVQPDFTSLSAEAANEFLPLSGAGGEVSAQNPRKGSNASAELGRDVAALDADVVAGWLADPSVCTKRASTAQKMFYDRRVRLARSRVDGNLILRRLAPRVRLSCSQITAPGAWDSFYEAQQRLPYCPFPGNATPERLASLSAANLDRDDPWPIEADLDLGDSLVEYQTDMAHANDEPVHPVLSLIRRLTLPPDLAPSHLESTMSPVSTPKQSLLPAINDDIPIGDELDGVLLVPSSPMRFQTRGSRAISFDELLEHVMGRATQSRRKVAARTLHNILVLASRGQVSLFQNIFDRVILIRGQTKE